MDIQQVLTSRGKQYGNFLHDATICQELKDVIWKYIPDDLMPDQTQALEMICVKIARILNGNPNYTDSWDDIAGYATLISNRLREGDDSIERL